MTQTGTSDYLFKDCALVEISHVHGCLRGAIHALVRDTEGLASVAASSTVELDEIVHFVKTLVDRFQTLWSVYSAHSQAEDQYIWPALRKKTSTLVHNSDRTIEEDDGSPGPLIDPFILDVVEPESYEQDHIEELEMFTDIIQHLLVLGDDLQSKPLEEVSLAENTGSILDKTHALEHHLEMHLQKEETVCLPLVVKYMSKEEIHDLIGKVMGTRSADTVAEIMNLAIENLPREDQKQMLVNMKEALAGTFFDRWLQMSGFQTQEQKSGGELVMKRKGCSEGCGSDAPQKRVKWIKGTDGRSRNEGRNEEDRKIPAKSLRVPGIAELAQLQKFAHAVKNNMALTNAQKCAIIKSLEDSMFKSSS